MWIDSHCHWDASEFDADRDAQRQAARDAGVTQCVIPAVSRSNWHAVINLAHRFGDVYALGIHPLYTPDALDQDLSALDALVQSLKGDPRLVAIGEIGLDYFVPALCTPHMRERQWQFYNAQLRIAKKYDLPVVLHVRRSADMLLKGLRQAGLRTAGIAHAFNGSVQQAHQFVDLGFKLGFGGSMTYDRALQIRRLAATLPLHALVLETDAPDIPPSWLYKTGQKNTPTQLPRIGHILAQLRGLPAADVAAATQCNAQSVLKLC